MNFEPLEDRVLIEPAEAVSRSAGGILIPDTAQQRPCLGVIRAVGDGTKEKPQRCHVGETVRYPEYAGAELKIDGTLYRIMRCSEVLGKVVG